MQSRLVLILDRETGLPIWYNIIPGNVLDINTVRSTLEDVAASIGIEIDSMILDAGYVSKDLILALKEENSDKFWVGKMPDRRGFSYRELYNHYVKPSISQGKYTFLRGKQVYFGKKVIWKLFDQNIFAYVYVDQGFLKNSSSLRLCFGKSLALYRNRLAIETCFYQLKTFWGMSEYRLLGIDGIENLLNLHLLNYSLVTLLPEMDKDFSPLAKISLQERRFNLGAFLSHLISIQKLCSDDLKDEKRLPLRERCRQVIVNERLSA